MPKKQNSPLSIFTGLAAIAMTVAGCGKSVADQLVGTWTVSKNLSDLSRYALNRPPDIRRKLVAMESSMRFTFTPTGVITAVIGATHQSGNYQISGHTVTFHFNGKSNKGDIAQDGSTVTIMTKSGSRIVLIKQSP